MLANLTAIDRDREHIFQFYAGTTYSEIKQVICAELELPIGDIRLAFAPGSDWCEPLNCFGVNDEEMPIVYLIHRDTYQDECREHLIERIGTCRVAVIREQLEWCRNYLPLVFDPNRCPAPWIVAVQLSALATLTLFAEFGAPGLNSMSSYYGETPLLCAIRQGHIRTVECLIAIGADVNCYRPLRYAVRLNRYNEMVALIAAGASIRAKDVMYSIVEESIRFPTNRDCRAYLSQCQERRNVVCQLMRDRLTYFGLLPMDLWNHYLDLYLYNGAKN